MNWKFNLYISPIYYTSYSQFPVYSVIVYRIIIYMYAWPRRVVLTKNTPGMEWRTLMSTVYGKSWVHLSAIMFYSYFIRILSASKSQDIHYSYIYLLVSIVFKGCAHLSAISVTSWHGMFEVSYWYLALFSEISKLYRGGQFYWW